MGRLWKRTSLTVAAAAVTALVLPATDASAINRVDCAGRTDFVTVWNGGEVCFANPGYQDVQIYNINDVGAGNNDLYYGYSINQTTRHLPPWHWQSYDYFDNGATGTMVWIQTFSA